MTSYRAGSQTWSTLHQQDGLHQLVPIPHPRKGKDWEIAFSGGKWSQKLPGLVTQHGLVYLAVDG